MQNEFKTPQGRTAILTIDDHVISFFWEDAMTAQRKWVEYQMELGHEVDENEKSVSAFYWILKNEWVNDESNRLDREDNWHKHMKQKLWFTEEMYNWINKNV